MTVVSLQWNSVYTSTYYFIALTQVCNFRYTLDVDSKLGCMQIVYRYIEKLFSGTVK